MSSSNIIPIVSSSPPPMDDSQSFGWDDDDDDDFGNFASAPGVESSASDLGCSEFDANWSQLGSAAVQFGDKESSSEKETTDFDHFDHDSQNKDALKESGNVLRENVSPSKSSLEDSGDAVAVIDSTDDDFADFAAFQDDSNSKNKPVVGSLPLQVQTTNQEGFKTSRDCLDSVEEGAETTMEKSRESTTTDSGVFSTDISPIPKSESFSVSEGDKIMQSEDETFSDLPQDSQQELPPDPPITNADISSPDSQKEHMDEEGADTSSESCSDSARNRDSAEASVSDRTCVTQDEEQTKHSSEGDFDSSEKADGSDQEKTDNSDCSLPLPQLDNDQSDNDHSNSGEEPDVDQQPASSEPNGLVGGDCTGKADDLELTPSAVEIEPPHKSEFSEVGENDESNTSGACADEDIPNDEGWAEFETSHSTPVAIPGSECQQAADPDDLVLRKDSVSFDEEDVSEKDVDFGDSDTPAADVASSHTPSPLSATEQSSDQISQDDIGEEDSDCGNFSEQPDCSESKTIPAEDGSEDLSTNEKALGTKDSDEDDFGDFSSKKSHQNITEKGDNDFSSSTKQVTSDSGDEDDFGDFSSTKVSQDKEAEENVNNFSSKEAVNDNDGGDDDFGDFSSQPLSSSAPASSSKVDDFGAFSEKPASSAADGDEFGDFSGQAQTASASDDSGWADFSGPSTADTQEEDFGNFSDTKPAAVQEAMPTSASNSSAGDMVQGTTFQKALWSCFPGSTAPPLLLEEETNGDTDLEPGSSAASATNDRLGNLETILKYGLRYRSASQQTWQVVQHPSKKDPRVKLWSHLQDVDGSPAVVYQWGKSNANSHLFSTLHIDTQNMLIGHKKPSVPIFATGLSLLEPIRGGGRERSLGMGSQPQKGSIPSVRSAAPTLIDPNQQDVERPTQDIPAVDFDWSTSGLTNPLTSKSLDLDFLVVQDNDASEKPAVFQSEILDAPRSSVKSSQPLEDILKSVKPTSVRSRRGDAATSHMSPEAARVLAGLPDLSFMQSKVLMFPIKN